MGRWIRFFLGTPHRFLGTLVGVGFFICLVEPTLFARALNQAVSAIIIALEPLLGPVLAVLIVFAGIKMILGGGRRRR